MFQTDPGLISIVTAPDLFYLDSPLIWRDSHVTITIPAGFISDDASIPKAMDWVPFLDRQGLSRLPGLAHDGIYSLGREKGKAWADMMLEQFCLAEGMNQFQAGCYYQGVDLFGQSSWDKDARVATFGAITSGDFYTGTYYRAWLAAGSTIYGSGGGAV